MKEPELEGKTDYFSPLDQHIGRFLSSLSPGQKFNTQLAASLISRNLRDGHVCLNLTEYAGKSAGFIKSDNETFIVPELYSWVESLRNDSCVGYPGEYKPLILDSRNRLYFHRYWQYEQDIIQFIQRRVSLENEKAEDREGIRRKLRLYFPETDNHEIYWPAVAAIAALLRKFLVITGSPGTGKTTTIARVLAFVNDVEQKTSRIALCAPTGKAAQRLEESVGNLKKRENWPEHVRHSIPDTASTVHRLLGSMRFSPYFQHHENNPLPYDIVIVDESSMVDLPLMAKLMRAIPEDARLILLGDKDQLASVEAGAVLGHICFPAPLNRFSDVFERKISNLYGKTANAAVEHPGVHDCIVELKKNYRFNDDSGLSVVSRAVKNETWDDVDLFLSGKQFPGIHFQNLLRAKKAMSEMIDALAESYREYFESVKSESGNHESIFTSFERFRVLCAMRVGVWGVETFNRLLEKSFAEKGWLSTNSHQYEARPIMVLQNDYKMKLFNGDIGIVLKDPQDDHKLKVFFKNGREGTRKIAIDRLPRHETVWAMTVHKSQGSEFDRIALILSDTDHPILTRELIYTGMTRARCSAEIWSGPDALKKAIQNPILRHSGLTDALRGV